MSNAFDNVGTPSDQYKVVEDDWKLVDDLVEGTSAMLDQREVYLPKEPKESDDAYDRRCGRSNLFSAYARALDSFVGKPFSQPVETEGMPSGLTRYLDNVDLCGNDLTAFAKQTFRNAIHYGVAHILTDYINIEEIKREFEQANASITLQDLENLGVRPYMCQINPRNLIGVKYSTVKGIEVPTQLRIRELYQEDEGEFLSKEQEQIRVIEPGAFRVFRKRPDSDEYVLFEEGEFLDFIPISTIYARRTDFMYGKPKMLDLARTNLAHFRSSSDQANILHTARVPILVSVGLDTSQLEVLPVGVGNLLVINDGATLEFVELTGKSIESGRQEIKDLEEQMEFLGLEPIIDRTGGITATATALSSVKTDTNINEVITNLQTTLGQALGFMNVWENRSMDDVGSIDIYKEWLKDLTAETSTAETSQDE